MIADLAAALSAAQGSGDRFAESRIIPALLRSTQPRHKSNQNDKRTDLERFYAKVAFGASDCWFWWGHLDDIGYGRGTHAGENKALGRRYGVSPMTIQRAVKGATWNK